MNACLRVAIDGADSKGKANDKEVCGDAAAVGQRRGQALRRRTAAKIKPVANPVSAAALGHRLRLSVAKTTVLR